MGERCADCGSRRRVIEIKNAAIESLHLCRGCLKKWLDKGGREAMAEKGMSDVYRDLAAKCRVYAAILEALAIKFERWPIGELNEDLRIEGRMKELDIDMADVKDLL